jgi:hypothetical protein
VEESQTKEQLVEISFLMFAGVKERLREFVPALFEVCFEATRWLCCQFEAILQYRHWEVVDWHRSQEKAKIFVLNDARLWELVDKFFEAWHPRTC